MLMVYKIKYISCEDTQLEFSVKCKAWL